MPPAHTWTPLIAAHAVAAGVAAARRGHTRVHRGIMMGTYAWGLIVTGLFTLLPNRLLGHAVWSALGLHP